MLQLECLDGAIAAKTIRADGSVVGYRAGARFLASPWEPTSGEDMVQRLAALRSRPDRCLVRGALAAWVDASQPIARRSRGDRAPIVPAASRVVCLDMDDLGPGGGAEEALRRVHAACPTLLAGPVVVHLTASHSTARGRAHVWCYLGRRASDAEVRRAVGHVADPSLYRPTQPHYTADPIFEGGGLDPYARERWQVFRFPGVAALAADDGAAAAAREAMAKAVERVKEAKPDRRHATLNREAYRIGQHIGRDLLDRTEAEEVMIGAALAAGLSLDRAQDETTRALDDGERDAESAGNVQAQLATDDKGKVRPTDTNAFLLLTGDARFAGRLGMNLHTRERVWLIPPPGVAYGEVVNAAHVMRLAEELRAASGGAAFSRASVESAIEGAALDHAFDPILEWLEGMPWDGVPRLDGALSRLTGAPDTAYHRGVSRALFLGLASRVLRPGCQHDLVVVLEGPQGAGKSTLLRAIGGDYYAELGALNDQTVYTLARSVMVEIGELSAMSTQEWARVKGLITRTEDVYRPPYERAAARFPRRCIMVATTNESGYQTDMTGGRRLLPVYMPRLNREALADIPQILGEAVARARECEAYHDVPDAEVAQDAASTIDPWVESIALTVSQREEVLMRDVLLGLELPASKHTINASRRAAAVLRMLGWERAHTGRGKVWRRGCTS
jgi:energy-coupling factor transporter ATP-binding protein EcfA2